MGETDDMRGASRGYTLLELGVVILVTAIVVSLAIPYFVSQRDRDREFQVRQNARTVQRVVEDWAAAHDGAMPGLDDLAPGFFPRDVYPPNPFTGEPSVIGPPEFRPGNIGYSSDGRVYTVEGYGADGIVITLTNG